MALGKIVLFFIFGGLIYYMMKRAGVAVVAIVMSITTMKMMTVEIVFRKHILSIIMCRKRRKNETKHNKTKHFDFNIDSDFCFCRSSFC